MEVRRRTPIIDIDTEIRIQTKIQNIARLSEQASGIDLLERLAEAIAIDPRDIYIDLDAGSILTDGKLSLAYALIDTLGRERADLGYRTIARLLLSPDDAREIESSQPAKIRPYGQPPLATLDTRIAAEPTGIDYIAIGPTRRGHPTDRFRLACDRNEEIEPLKAIGRITAGFPLAKQQDERFERRWGLARLAEPIAEAQISSSIFSQVSSIYEFVW